MKDKKILLIVLSCFLFLPFIVDAKSGYLYDVLKNEAESNGLAKEYTGDHHDSFTEEPTHKIYYWYGPSNANANTIKNSWNVIFGGFCWQMIRTTDTGGIKMIYNGLPNNGKCNNSGSDQRIGTSYYNRTWVSPAYVGYMYNPNTARFSGGASQTPQYSGWLFGTNVNYHDGIYELVNTGSYDAYHHYTCINRTGTCETVRYYYYDESFMKLSDGETIEKVLENMLWADDVNQEDSTIKTAIDTWYQNNMIPYSSKIEDTIYCNDRSTSDLGAWNPNGGGTTSGIMFKNNGTNSDLNCTNITDKFSLSNNKAHLTYPVGLITKPEMSLLGNNKIIYTNNYYWLLSPTYYGNNGALVSIVGSTGELTHHQISNRENDIRPAISLKANSIYGSGDGSNNNPYIIRDLYKSNIIINNDNTKGIIANLDNTTNVEELSEVSFEITPKEGYLVKEISVKDSNNEDVEYIKNGDTYSFVMPDSDVTITPIYEKVKSSISIEIINETEDLNIDVTDITQVEYNEEVRFRVKPIRGYKITDIKILDEYNEEIEYTKNADEDEYIFVMPARNVTIIPSYERVSNEVIVDDKPHTKEIVIEVNDAKAVVYEDIVIFTVEPEEGYEVENIIIKDKNNNTISYRKLSKNKYEFTMPDTDVTIIPMYKKIESINVPNTLKNPKTGYKLLLIISLIIINIVLGTYAYKKSLIKN